MDFSVGKAIRKINKNGLESFYFLLGDDFYLQNFFTNYVKKNFDNKLKVKRFNLKDTTDQELLFNDLSSLSLFSNKNIFSIRNADKIESHQKEYLLKYISKPNQNNVLIFILDDYIIKNSFLKELHKKCVKINTNTPFFSSKIKDWAKYYINVNGIQMDNEILDYLVNSYGDSISNVINEIEKVHLMTNMYDLKFSDYKSDYMKRNVKNWHLMKSLGMKNLSESIEIFDNLIINGSNLVPVITNLSTFYSALLCSYLNDNMRNFRLNNTIKSKITQYSKNYSYDEISNIILEMRDIDIIIKSSNIKHELIFHPFLVKICKGYYV